MFRSNSNSSVANQTDPLVELRAGGLSQKCSPESFSISIYCDSFCALFFSFCFVFSHYFSVLRKINFGCHQFFVLLLVYFYIIDVFFISCFFHSYLRSECSQWH